MAPEGEEADAEPTTKRKQTNSKPVSDEQEVEGSDRVVTC